jgi:GDP-L-fucose synthase
MTKYFVAGNTGLAGSAICRKLDSINEDYFGAASKEVDFKDYNQTLNILKEHNPEIVIIAAARVGGIKANNDYPVEFFNENMLIGMNIINAAFELKIPNLIFLGSSCIYPKYAEQPMREDSLLTGQLEDTNRAYSIAKIACVELIKAYRREYGVNWFSVMPTNLYGENDNFDLNTSHVMPAILRKIHEAKVNGSSTVDVWGSGNPKREFMSSDDLADAIVFLANNKPEYDLINIGVGSDITLKELTTKIASIVGYEGDFVWNTDISDGPPRKLMNSDRLFEMGWEPKIDLDKGIKDFYKWYINK